MRISAIIPNFNDVRVERALNHLFAQTHGDKQIIVVDGGSRVDKVHEIYQRTRPNVLVSEPDNGIFDALNKGVRLSDGEVIFLQGSDDFLPDPTTFEAVSKYLESRPDLDGVCIGCHFVDDSGRTIRIWHQDLISSFRIFLGLYPPHFSLFLRRRVYDTVGEFQVAKTRNVATDSLWLVDAARKCYPLRIDILAPFHLKMEYGGASTGSISGIIRQFHMVRRYVRDIRLPFRLVHPYIKVLSKVGQFSLVRRSK